MVDVQRKPNLNATPDTTIIRGDSVELHASVETDVTGYKWSPTDSLQCITCKSPYARPFYSTVYTATVEDPNGCFVEKDEARIEVVDKFKIALPEAFTPNGDGINDKIFVKGWGIDNLITFKVYNRWGELVFQTDDIEEGWNGIYKNQPQNPGAYSYYVKAESYTGEVASRKGMFNLIR